MRLRPRLTVRVLMALVAIVALVLGGVRARQHYTHCMKVADGHRRSLTLLDDVLSIHQRVLSHSKQSLPRWREEIVETKKAIAKYEAREKPVSNHKGSTSFGIDM